MKDGWQLIYADSPMNKDTRCLFVNELDKFNDGYKETNLKVWLSIDDLELQSASNFDLSYPDTGVYFLGKEGAETSFSLTSTDKPTSLVTSINQQLDRATTEKLVIKIGFWPSWPVTKTTEITFLFSQRKEMLALQDKCNTLQAALK